MKITIDLNNQDLQQIFKQYVEEATGQTPETVEIRDSDYATIEHIIVEF